MWLPMNHGAPMMEETTVTTTTTTEYIPGTTRVIQKTHEGHASVDDWNLAVNRHKMLRTSVENTAFSVAPQFMVFAMQKTRWVGAYQEAGIECKFEHTFTPNCYLLSGTGMDAGTGASYSNGCWNAQTGDICWLEKYRKPDATWTVEFHGKLQIAPSGQSTITGTYCSDNGSKGPFQLMYS